MMDKFDIFLDKFPVKSAELKSRIMRYDEDNNKLDKVIKDEKETQCLYNKVVDRYDAYDLLSKLSVEEDNNFKKRRLEFLCKYIDSNMESIFPEKQYKSFIDADFKNNNQKTRLLLYKDGKTLTPKLQSGKYLQELIRFSSSAAIIECQGGNKIYMDEAFSASSIFNLTKTGELLRKLITSNFQILLIEQKDDIYKDLPRREFRLKYNNTSKSAEIVDVVDL